MKTIKLICCTGALLGLGIMSFTLNGCSSPTVDTGSYDSSEAGKVNKVVPGTIMSERPVVINSQIPDDGSTDTNSNVPSAYTAGAENHTSGYEYIIKLDSGAMISVVQADTLQLKPKQRVLVIYGATTRVVADGTAG